MVLCWPIRLLPGVTLLLFVSEFRLAEARKVLL